MAQLIPDPSAQMPSDWSEDEDGEWEAPKVSNPACSVGCGEWKRPMIPNPEYKGKWVRPMIDNADYNGEWKPRQIDNPDFFVEVCPRAWPTSPELHEAVPHPCNSSH